MTRANMPEQKSIAANGKSRREKGDTRERILEVAEELFAKQGYSETSLRQIAQEADANVALTYYHFKSKADLYIEVYLRCAAILKEQRSRMLDAAERASQGRAVPLSEIIKAFVMPALYMLQDTEGRGQHYIQLASRIHNEPPEIASAVLGKIVDASTLRFVEAIHKALPHLDRETIHWRVFFMFGVFMYTVAGTGRLEAISGGQSDPRDIDRTIEQMLPFLVAGFQSPEPKSRPIEK